MGNACVGDDYQDGNGLSLVRVFNNNQGYDVQCDRYMQWEKDSSSDFV